MKTRKTKRTSNIGVGNFALLPQPPPVLSAPIRAPDQAAEPGFKAFPEGQKCGADLTSNRKIFQRPGARTQKALLLDSISQNSLAEWIHSWPLFLE